MQGDQKVGPLQLAGLEEVLWRMGVPLAEVLKVKILRLALTNVELPKQSTLWVVIV